MNTLETKVCALLEEAGFDYSVFQYDEDIAIHGKTKGVHFAINITGAVNIHVECETLVDDNYQVINTKSYKRLTAIIPFINRCVEEAARIQANLITEADDTFEDDLERAVMTEETFESFFETATEEEPVYILMNMQDPVDNEEVTLQEARDFYLGLDFMDEFESDAAYDAFTATINEMDADTISKQLEICDYMLLKTKEELQDWLEEVQLKDEPKSLLNRILEDGKAYVPNHLVEAVKTLLEQKRRPYNAFAINAIETVLELDIPESC